MTGRRDEQCETIVVLDANADRHTSRGRHEETGDRHVTVDVTRIDAQFEVVVREAKSAQGQHECLNHEQPSSLHTVLP
jgi:hypothetical protein